MSVLNPTAGITNLLEMVGIESEEELFTSTTKLATDSPLAIINMQVWRALDDYRDGERSFRENVLKTAEEATQQLDNVDSGRTPDASWFTHYAKNAADAQTKMTEAVSKLHNLVAVRRALLAVA